MFRRTAFVDVENQVDAGLSDLQGRQSPPHLFTVHIGGRETPSKLGTALFPLDGTVPDFFCYK
jgi:hypothetical protein